MTSKDQKFPPKNRRISKPKVRTGCITCKSRRVKCDEGKPSCQRCIDFRRICSGYKTRDPVAETSRALAPASSTFRLILTKPTFSADLPGDSKNSSKVESYLNYQPFKPEAAKYEVVFNTQKGPPSFTLQMNALIPRDISNYLSQNQLVETEHGKQMIYTSVRHIIHATGRPLVEIVEQFFCGISQFIPGISCARVQNGISSLAIEIPSMGFSMLLLAICLITFHRKTPGCLPARLDQQSLYITTKMLFSQVNKVITQTPPSITLIQAGIVVAVYEYARGMPDKAFQSLSGCADMGNAANLPRWIDDPREGCLWKEEVNTWWAILIYERSVPLNPPNRLLSCSLAESRAVASRLSYCDMAPVNQTLPFSATMPSADFILPVEPDKLDLQDSSHSELLVIDTSVPGNIGPQAWSAQGIWILDQIHQIRRLGNGNYQLTQLVEIDERLQTFAMDIMSQFHTSHDIFCGSVAIVIRSLFLLHEHILAKGPRIVEPGNDWWLAQKRKSNNALETATNMMLDIIDAESQDRSPESCPPSRLYRLRAALKFLEQRPDLRQYVSYQAAEKRLRAKLDAFNRYWDVELADT